MSEQFPPPMVMSFDVDQPDIQRAIDRWYNATVQHRSYIMDSVIPSPNMAQWLRRCIAWLIRHDNRIDLAGGLDQYIKEDR